MGPLATDGSSDTFFRRIGTVLGPFASRFACAAVVMSLMARASRGWRSGNRVAASSSAFEFFSKRRNGCRERFFDVVHKDEIHVGFHVLR